MPFGPARDARGRHTYPPVPVLGLTERGGAAPPATPLNHSTRCTTTEGHIRYARGYSFCAR